jgi:hypothetical protein
MKAARVRDAVTAFVSLERMPNNEEFQWFGLGGRNFRSTLPGGLSAMSLPE